MHPEQPLSPALTRLIDALAEHLVQEYLTEQAALRRAGERLVTDQAELPPVERAA